MEEDSQPVAKYRPEVESSAVRGLQKNIRARKPVGQIIKDLLSDLFELESDFTFANYEDLVGVLTEFLDFSEESRKEKLAQMISVGEVPSDAETKLQSCISAWGLSDKTWADQHAADLCRMPYYEFLGSQYWSLIRAVVVSRCHGKCQLCSRPGPFHVHHKTYEHHGYEHAHLEDLICLCRSCHEKFHDKLPRGTGNA